MKISERHRDPTPRHFLLATLVGLAMLASTALRIAWATPAGEGVPERTVALTESWRVGEDEDDVLLVLPVDVAFDTAGRTYVMDMRDQHVLVFDREGDLVTTLSSQGEGPGQTQAGAGIFILPPDTLCIMDMLPLRIVRLLLDGTPLPSIALEEPGSTRLAVPIVTRTGGDRLAVMVQELVPGEDEGTIQRRLLLELHELPSGRRIATLATQEITLTPGRPARFKEEQIVPPQTIFDVDDRGFTYVCESRDQYRIGVYDRQGHLVRTIERDEPPFRRQKAVMSIQRGILRALARSLLIRKPEIEIAETEAAIVDIRCLSDGTIWVLTGRGRGGVYQRSFLPFGIYDVLSPAGKRLRRDRIVCDGNPILDVAYPAPDGRLVMIRNYHANLLSTTGNGGIVNVGRDDEPVMIVCYEPTAGDGNAPPHGD